MKSRSLALAYSRLCVSLSIFFGVVIIALILENCVIFFLPIIVLLGGARERHREEMENLTKDTHNTDESTNGKLRRGMVGCSFSGTWKMTIVLDNSSGLDDFDY